MPGTGGPGWQIKAEFNNKSHTRGVLSMARSSNPDSAGSQFFICHGDAKFLDRQYTAFGQVIAGDGVLEKLANVPHQVRWRRRKEHAHRARRRRKHQDRCGLNRFVPSFSKRPVQKTGLFLGPSPST